MKELYIQATVEFFSLSSTVQFFPPKVLHSMFIFLKLKNDPYTAGDLNSTRLSSTLFHVCLSWSQIL